MALRFLDDSETFPARGRSPRWTLDTADPDGGALEAGPGRAYGIELGR
jgi:hypothetical protein